VRRHDTPDVVRHDPTLHYRRRIVDTPDRITYAARLFGMAGRRCGFADVRDTLQDLAASGTTMLDRRRWDGTGRFERVASELVAAGVLERLSDPTPPEYVVTDRVLRGLSINGRNPKDEESRARALNTTPEKGACHLARWVQFRSLPKLAGSAREEDIAEYVLDVLGDHFHIEREVWGKHWTGKPLRIDAIMRPRDTAGWPTPAVLGVEFKSTAVWGHSDDAERAAAQAIDYAHTAFGSYGLVPVFLCPSPLERFTPNTWDGIVAPREDQRAAALCRMLWQFKIGGLSYAEPHGWALTSGDGSQLVWAETSGPARTPTPLERRTGTRT